MTLSVLMSKSFYLFVVQFHLEMLEKQEGFFFIDTSQVCILFHRFVSKRVECQVWIKKEACRCLACSMVQFIHPLAVHKNRVITLFLVERKSESTVGCAKVDSHGCKERLFRTCTYVCKKKMLT